jgi:importin subunit beta-1
MLELVKQVLADENSVESLDKVAYGVLGDLADAFPNGQIKQLLLHEWVARYLNRKNRYAKDTKQVIRWAREVSGLQFYFNGLVLIRLGQVMKLATQ